jgi:hypothetical protein
MRAVARLPLRVKLAVATVKLTALLVTPPTVTTTPPVVVPAGTVAAIDVTLQLVIAVAGVPLNVTALVPWVEPKLVPVIVTDAPIAAEVGDKLVMLGAANRALDEAIDTKNRTASGHLFLSGMFQSPSLSLNRFAVLRNNQLERSIQGRASDPVG